MISSAIIPQPLAKLPWRLIMLVFAICAIGIATLYSAAGGSFSPWAMKQAIIIATFFLIALGVSWVPEDSLKQLVIPGYILVCLMLVAVEAIGFVGKGAQRWVDLGFIRLQPSEFMKPGIVLILARFYDLLPVGDVRKWRGLWPAAALMLVPAALILVQPDLGTAMMVLMSGVTVMFLAGLPLWYFLSGLGAMAVAGPVLFATMHDYQRKRVLIFMDPESDPLGAGYHISQSKIAIGSGGVWGKGFLHGSQSHLDYLPEGHTDFAFATMVEEWGLVGGALLIIAFLFVVRWGMKVGRNAPTRFGQLTAAGLSMTIFFYFAVNLMMVMGLAPVVGIPLPLVSFGGSAVMTVMLCLGVLMGLERQQRSTTQLE